MPPGFRPAILVTNDDGIDSEGLRILSEKLAALGEVTAVAPNREMSACSHSISLFRPVGYERVGPNRYAVDGTPVDAVVLAVNHLLSRKPDLLVSGINKGANLGQNVFYSGTVAAAVEGTFHGVPSIAVSICSKQEFLFQPAAAFAEQLARLIWEEGLPAGVTLNVNVPAGWSGGVRLTRRATRVSRQLVVEGDGPEKNAYRINEKLDWAKIAPDTDYAAIRERFISITPLTLECPEGPAVPFLERWIQTLPSEAVR